MSRCNAGAISSLLVGLCCALAPGRCAGAVVAYEVVDLGTLEGDAPRPNAINEAGQIVGSAATPTGDYRAFLWLPEPAYGLPAGMHDLSAGEVGTYIATDINNSGQIVGSYWTEEDINGVPIAHAYIWDPLTHAFTDLGELPGDVASWGEAISDAGQVVGISTIISGKQHRSFLWLPLPAYGFPAGMNEIGDFGSMRRAYDINALGQIVGTNDTDCTPCDRSFIWPPEPAYGLPAGINSLEAVDTEYAVAYAINDAGQAVGMGYPLIDPPDYWWCAILWNSGVPTDLGAPGGFRSEARDINNAGQVIGYTDALDPGWGYFLWEGGVLTAITDLLPPGYDPALRAINDHGQIVGFATFDEESHAVLLNPIQLVPAVSAWGIAVTTLVMLAAAALVFRGRNKPGMAPQAAEASIIGR